MAARRTRLIYCRTPLQSLMAMRIQERDPARDTIVYQPNSNSAKHKRYFDRMVAAEKHFIEWKTERPSHLMKEISSYFSIPSHVRKSGYDDYLVSSVGSLPISLLLTGRSGDLHTYDDGMFNLLGSEVELRLEGEPWHHRLIKKVVNAPTNAELVRSASRHYTMFPPSLLHPCWNNPVPINLFPKMVAAPQHSNVDIVLGTFLGGFASIPSASSAEDYLQLIERLNPDLFLPHPGELASPRIGSKLSGDQRLAALVQEAIAEEVIMYLSSLGYELTVYGFSSTTLANVASHARVFNILLPGLNDLELEIFGRLGIRSVPAEELLTHGRSLVGRGGAD